MDTLMQVMSFPDTRIRVAYLDVPGEEPAAAPYLYLHGLGSSSIATFPAIAAGAGLRRHRAVLVDLPGFGYSVAPADWSFTIEAFAEMVAAVLDRLSLPPVRLVGHSMGGSVAIGLAHRRPDRVARLYVAEPNLDPGSGTLSGHITRLGEAAFVERGYARLVRAMDGQAARGDRAAAIFAGTVRQSMPQALHRAATSLRAARTPTFREQLLALPMPCTWIAGDRTHPIPPADLTARGIDIVTIPNAGHTMMDDNPDAFAAAIA